MRSNAYTLIFTSTVTIVLGFLLSMAVTILKDQQDLNIEIDIKKNILRSLDFALQKKILGHQKEFKRFLKNIFPA